MLPPDYFTNKEDRLLDICRRNDRHHRPPDLENAAVIRVMDAEYKKSLGELTNLTRTIMKQSQIDLINMLDEADLRVAAGVQSYSAAVCDILDRYAGQGLPNSRGRVGIP